MEAERDRVERAARERAEAEARAERRRLEEEQARLKQTNWSAVIGNSNQVNELFSFFQLLIEKSQSQSFDL